jgi:hypothetical protein
MTVHEYMVRLRTGRLIFGYFDSETAALHALAQLAPDSYVGVWRALNPVRSDSPLLVSLNAPLHASNHRAGAKDIAQRSMLLLDFDADCPSDAMSTDSEHSAAIAQAGQCSTWLQSFGWPRPKQIDSGRGCQLHAVVNLPADLSTDELVKNLLRSVKVRYPLIDAGTYDRPRFARLPGFWNRKAECPTAERPHRIAKLLDAGDSGLVSAEQIEAVIARIGVPAASQPCCSDETPNPERVERTIVKLTDFLARIGVELTAIVPLHDGRTFLRLSHCPLNPEHLGSSAGIGVSVSGRPQNLCKHSGCTMPWAEWRAAVEKLYGIRMELSGKVIFSKRGTKN